MSGGFKSLDECQKETKNYAKHACPNIEVWYSYGNLEKELSKIIIDRRLFRGGEYGIYNIQ
jgi:hypothetical protein